MGAHEGKLQLRTLLFRNMLAGERAESGGDAVDRRRVVGQLLHALPGRAHLFQGGRIQLNLCTVAGDCNHLVDGQRTNAYGDGIRVANSHFSLLTSIPNELGRATV